MSVRKFSEMSEDINATLPDRIVPILSAFKCRIMTYRLAAVKESVDIKGFIHQLKPDIINLINTTLKQHRGVKVNMELFGEYVLSKREDEEISKKSFNSKFKVVEVTTDVTQLYDEFCEIILRKAQEFQESKSGWALKKLLHMDLNINKYTPTIGSSYIPLPKTIVDKKAVVNIKNEDQECFKWSVLAALHPARGHAERVSNYSLYDTELNFGTIECPVELSDIAKFETLNSISVNVYGLEKFEDKYMIVGPLHFTKQRREIHINLLLITDNENSHYCWIKNLSRLVSSQTNLSDHAKFICDGCLIHFRSLEKLNRHKEYDCDHVAVLLPTEAPKKDWFGRMIPGNILKFQNYTKSMRVPFVIYADFESILEPVQTCESNPCYSNTTTTHLHKPHSFAYLIKCSYDDSLSKFVSYRGQDCVEKFVDNLEQDVRRIYLNYLKIKIPLKPLTSEQQENFDNAQNCHICELPLNGDVVVDHNHLTGVYTGPAHQNCNLNFRIPKFLPIFFHNLSGYDAHLFIKQLACENEALDVIAQNKERYISFTKHIKVDDYIDRVSGHQKNVYIKLRFLDSFRFMASSLDALASNLCDDDCLNIKNYYPNQEQFVLMRQKGVFPYEFVDGYDKLNFPRLPDRSDFYSSLNESGISEEEYSRAEKVWETFNCNSLGEYSDIYLKTDVLLLADVFENFRNVCLNSYKLDPAQFYTCAGLSWDAMLKSTRIELELLTDVDMHHFLKKSIRGGVAMCVKREAKANNKFIPNFNSTEPTSFLMYLDATNLYGAAMSHALPQSNFKWVEMKDFDVTKIPDDNPEGYIMEVDLEYPEELHDTHNDLPLCPEKMISPIAMTKVEKLIPNLYDKKRYILHYRNLKQVLKLGMRLNKIHRILSFKQSPWLKSYIDINTKYRNASTNKFEKNFYKLMNNSVFGKTMENVDKRVDVRLVTSWENIGRKSGAESLIAQPNFKNCKIFTENLVAIQMNKLKVTYNKPIYCGSAILDISKLIMYEFFYGYLKSRYGSNVNLLYTDTDSLILEVFTDNFYDDMKSHIQYFDTSNYSPTNKHDIPTTPSVLGNMKDEYAGSIIYEFYGTGAKAYCVVSENYYSNRAKGIKSAIAKQLTVEAYRSVIHEEPVIMKKMRTFRTDHHDVSTNLINKVALTKFDDKRLILDDKINSLAWGHFKIKDLG